MDGRHNILVFYVKLTILSSLRKSTIIYYIEPSVLYTILSPEQKKLNIMANIIKLDINRYSDKVNY